LHFVGIVVSTHLMQRLDDGWPDAAAIRGCETAAGFDSSDIDDRRQWWRKEATVFLRKDNPQTTGSESD
jgi:hypothetical protein